MSNKHLSPVVLAQLPPSSLKRPRLRPALGALQQERCPSWLMSVLMIVVPSFSDTHAMLLWRLPVLLY